jgi:hypothetical protein
MVACWELSGRRGRLSLRKTHRVAVPEKLRVVLDAEERLGMDSEGRVLTRVGEPRAEQTVSVRGAPGR